MNARFIYRPPGDWGYWLIGTWLLVARLPLTAEVIYREDFNTDGAVGPEPRYTIGGSFVSEPPHDAGSIGNAPDQLGPVYWARNAEVSFVGVPAPTKGRRALLAWDGALLATSPGGASPEVMQLVLQTVAWLASFKPNAIVVLSPNVSVAPSLSEALTSAGYVVVDDDRVTADTAYPGDVVIKGPDAELASRFANAPQGVLAFGAIEHDDMLTSSIGSTAAFQPGPATLVTPTHPVAAGLPTQFSVAEVSATWNLMGDTLPGGAITIARMSRVVPPTVGSLAEVEAMVSGSRDATRESVTATEFDFSDASAGDWPIDQTVPGGASGLWGLVVSGRLSVAFPGRVSLAVGVDDGARLRVDRNRNGLGPEDTVLVADAPGAHRALYADVDFPAAGEYAFEVMAFNSGGPGSLEMSVSLQEGGGDTSAISSGSWEMLGATSGPASLLGELKADSYIPSSPPEEVTVPLLVLLNGPGDTPPGAVFGGGAFGGFEGSGFFAGSGLNKWLPETIESMGGYRSLRLKPVDVTGRTNVTLSAALAATFLDFETSDFLDLVVYPNGVASPEVRLARFSAPNATSKYFVDTQNGGINQLGVEFRDVTYPVPGGATSLIVEIRAFTSWWNEIVGFDNLRIQAGGTPTPPSLGLAREGADLILTFTGTLEGSLDLDTWTPVDGPPTSPWRVPAASLVSEPTRFFRAIGGR